MALIIAVLHAVMAVSLYFLQLPVAAVTLGILGFLLSAYLTPWVYAHRGDLALYGQQAARASWHITSSAISRWAYALSLLLVYASLSLAVYALVPTEWFSGVFFGTLSLLSVLIASLALRSQIAPHHFFVATLFFLLVLLVPIHEGYMLRITAAIIHLIAMTEILRKYTLPRHGVLFVVLAVSLICEVLTRSFDLTFVGTLFTVTIATILAFELSERVPFLTTSHEAVRVIASLLLSLVSAGASIGTFWYDPSSLLVTTLVLSSLFLITVHIRYCNLLTFLVALFSLALFAIRLIFLYSLSPWFLLTTPLAFMAGTYLRLPHSVDKKALSVSALISLMVVILIMIFQFAITSLWAYSLDLLLLAAAAVTVARSFRR